MGKFLALFSIGLLFLSCSKLEKKVEGAYSIDELIVNGELLTYSLGANMISFGNDQKCNLPTVLDEESNYLTEIRTGSWKLNSIDTMLSITSEHSILRGKFKLSFEKDFKRKLLQIVLENDSVHLRASKFMQNFDKNGKSW